VRLQAPGFIVNTGMNYTAVMAGLVLCQTAFLLQQQYFFALVALFQVPGRGQSDDAAAYDDEIEFHCCSMPPGCL